MTKIEDNYLVSIIVITYNSSKYVVETLESAKIQTYQNVELIISDDGSTDETVQICRNWIEENGHRFLRTELVSVPQNTGIPANCNRGVASAKGEWVKLIAGDDCMLPEAIEANLNQINNQKNIKILFSALHIYLREFEENNFLHKQPRSLPKRLFNDNISSLDQYIELLINGFCGLAPSLFAHKQTIIDVGGFDERFRLIEDYPMFFRLTSNGIKMHYFDIVTVKYRRHEDSVHNHLQKQILKPSFLRNEEMRKEYVYPFITKFYYLKKKYAIFLYKFFNFIGINKNIKVFVYLYHFLADYMNVFTFVEFISEKLLRIPIKKIRFDK